MKLRLAKIGPEKRWRENGGEVVGDDSGDDSGRNLWHSDGDYNSGRNDGVGAPVGKINVATQSVAVSTTPNFASNF